MKRTHDSIEVWKQSLHDTTKRNNSINFKPAKLGHVEIVYPNISTIFEFADNKKIEIANLFATAEKNEDDEIVIFDQVLKDKELYSLEDLEPIINIYETVNKVGNKINFYSNVKSKKLNGSLKNIADKTRLFRDENAINICYLAFGLVNWRENENSNEYYQAPLLFLGAELKQEAINAPYKLVINGDDFLVNESFLSMLEQTFNIKIDFKIDDNKSYYDNYLLLKEKLVSKIYDQKWTINDSVNLSYFTFSKINILKDIEKNYENIVNNEIIQVLSGTDIEDNKTPFELKEEDLDSTINPNSYFRVYDADSSQEIAIEAAINGNSFVLQGPPGTGKSQTISNIISELISRGKKVLFVAEKKAALDVVYNNLKNTDLHSFALPLHNKDHKAKDLVMELYDTINNGTKFLTIKDDVINNLEHKFSYNRNKLNDYANSLTKVRKPLNKTIYDLYGNYVELYTVKDFKFDIPNIETIDNSTLEEILNVIKNFKQTHQEIDYCVTDNPWYRYKYDHLSSLKEEDLKDLLKNTLMVADNINQLLIDNPLKLITEDKTSLNDLSIIYKLLELFSKLNPSKEKLINYYFDHLIKNSTLDNELIKLLDLIELESKIKELSSSITSTHGDKIFEFDYLNNDEFINKKDTFIKRLFSKKYKVLKKSFKELSLNKKNNYNEINKTTKDLNHLNTLVEEFDLKYQNYSLVKDNITSKESLSQTKEDISWLIEIFNFVNKHNFKFNSDLNNVFKSLIDFDSMFEYLKDFNNNLNQLQDYVNSLEESFEDYARVYSNKDVNDLIELLELQLLEFDALKPYIRFKNNYKKGEEYNLLLFFQEMIKQSNDLDYVAIFLKRFYFLLIDSFIESDSVLKEFNVVDYEGYKNNFAASDRDLISSAKVSVVNNIRMNYPKQNGFAAKNYDIDLLKKEANKSRRHLPIRKLIEEIPDLITKLKPLLMMSPLSVSKYFINSDIKFDTVIFDEASQITPESAIGAIFRSSQVIIVGDKEQLPPTNFFNNSFESTEDFDDTTDVDAFDSILELASGMIDNIHLKWHYRSKHEELIKPSNDFIYNNLISFPSALPKTKNEGIEFHKIDGVYENRMNQIEADEVARLVFEHFDKFGYERTLGVVTFNEGQQRAVWSAIDKLRIEKPIYEKYFNSDLVDPFFVKNIESVQGDERDTIFVTIGFARNATGNLSMNFGPINKEGGYRRLNVAFTRAKQNLVLITSITDKDIDLNRTSSQGMKFLKNYLHFAEYGHDLEDETLHYNSNFEDDVYDVLSKLNYTVDKNVGSSNYKIDLAIKNDEGKYILGIECDGSTYLNQKTARTRDRLRQDVLEARGWNIHRVWSTDWFNNRENEINRIVKAITDISNQVDDNKMIPDYSNNLEIEVNEIIKEDKVLFEDYPNYETFNFNSYGDTSRIKVLEKIISTLSPISINEMKKFIPIIYNREFYSSRIADMFSEDLKRMSYNGTSIEYKNKFFIDRNKYIRFRKHGLNSSRRDISNILVDEIKVGLLTIVNSIVKIDQDVLIREINSLLGYQVLSKKNRTVITEALQLLIEDGKVNIDSNIIEKL